MTNCTHRLAHGDDYFHVLGIGEKCLDVNLDIVVQDWHHICHECKDTCMQRQYTTNDCMHE